ncbi:hypothetical protein GCM10011390_10190 [Aureimonas endophytica]|uniref:Uncharacterized protein n=1 Tax=Aureimonas endophytica TaxID=2027858 RepID=A0A917E123_9HYPH|nr:hypothetical protein GCM10011390_10190 [Aureimonas endophytica]
MQRPNFKQISNGERPKRIVPPPHRGRMDYVICITDPTTWPPGATKFWENERRLYLEELAAKEASGRQPAQSSDT